MTNKEIAFLFRQIANILQIKGENAFRVISYNRAAETIENYPHELEELYHVNPKLLVGIPGIGESLREKIEEMLKTGQLKFYEKLLKTFNKGLLTLLEIRGLGPKKVKLLYEELGIDSIEDLKKAAKSHKIKDLPRMGKKSEAQIFAAIEDFEKYQKRSLLSDALEAAERYLAYLRENPLIIRAQYAGSLRRRKETIGDLDLLVVGKDHKKISDYFCAYNLVDKVIAKGDTKSSIILQGGMQVDLRVLDENEFGAALHYFTGSKEHNVALRDRAKKMGLKISEYGIFKGAKKIGGKTEEEVFKKTGLPYIDPEIRENRGEIEAAHLGKLPVLIRLEDLKGDLHVHTNWSDGHETLENMVEAAREKGFSYIAISDHSKSLRVANGLDEKRILAQIKEIDDLNQRISNFTILKGAEVDILEDGTLDFPDEILAKLDIVIGSVHSKFNLSKNTQTNRVIKAIQNHYLTILGHPTGRLLNQRNPIQIDMEAIIDMAKKYHKILEINANPYRLDLNDLNIKLAKEKGLLMAINSDSHSISNFDLLKYGIYTARRGWIEKTSVINTRNIDDLKKIIRETRL